MALKIVRWILCLLPLIVGTPSSAAGRYEFLFTAANYSSVEQSELDYTSFIGDEQTGAIYFCSGKIKLKKTDGRPASHDGSCVAEYAPPSGAPSDFTFARLSALDSTANANAPKMNPAWGFWRIDQTRRRHAFCGRFGAPTAVWACFEASLP
jgi:hypothetical protein